MRKEKVTPATTRGEAERIVREVILVVPGRIADKYIDAIDKALQARDERAAKVAETHLHVPACDGAGCKVVIAARIRKG